MEISKFAEIVFAKIDTEGEVTILFRDNTELSFTVNPSEDDDGYIGEFDEAEDRLTISFLDVKIEEGLMSFKGKTTSGFVFEAEKVELDIALGELNDFYTFSGSLQYIHEEDEE